MTLSVWGRCSKCCYRNNKATENMLDVKCVVLDSWRFHRSDWTHVWRDPQESHTIHPCDTHTTAALQGHTRTHTNMNTNTHMITNVHTHTITSNHTYTHMIAKHKHTHTNINTHTWRHSCEWVTQTIKAELCLWLRDNPAYKPTLDSVHIWPSPAFLKSVELNV